MWMDKRAMFILTNITVHPEKAVFKMNMGMLKSRQLWQITTVTWMMMTKQTGWQVATQRSNMEVDKEALFPPISPGCSQQLHPSIFMWWEENVI
jgi:hypothetical protein